MINYLTSILIFQFQFLVAVKLNEWRFELGILKCCQAQGSFFFAICVCCVVSLHRIICPLAHSIMTHSLGSVKLNWLLRYTLSHDRIFSYIYSIHSIIKLFFTNQVRTHTQYRRATLSSMGPPVSHAPQPRHMLTWSQCSHPLRPPHVIHTQYRTSMRHITSRDALPISLRNALR